MHLCGGTKSPKSTWPTTRSVYFGEILRFVEEKDALLLAQLLM